MGSVVLSVDAELGWGFHDLPSPPSDRVEAGRRGWGRLIELCEIYDIPATWGVVGHLMLEECDGEHRTHPAPATWFADERRRWTDRPDLRFAPDLVQRLLQSPVPHEVACHSFSHVRFDADSTTPELAAAEIDRSLQIAREWGLTVESFIFPRNGIAFRDLLASAGIRSYRGAPTGPHGIRRMVRSMLDADSLLVHPTVDEFGLVNVPASLFLFGFERPWRTVVESVWRDPLVAVASRGIESAARQDGICHLWLHPNNLIGPDEDRRIERIFECIDRMRTEHGLEVETMHAIARRVNKPPNRTGPTAGMVADGGDGKS